MEQEIHLEKNNGMYGKTSWNKDLTKYTNNKIKEMSKNTSQTRKEMFNNYSEKDWSILNHQIIQVGIGCRIAKCC